MVSQAVLSVLVVLIPSGIMCAALSSSSSSTSSSSSAANGGTNAQFAQTQTFPGAGFGYNYGNIYPSYPNYNPYGQIYPANQVQTATSLTSRGSFGDDTPASGQATIITYGPNSVGTPPNYNPYLNNLQQQQQNAFFQQQLLQQQLLQQQLQQQQLLNFQNPVLGVPNQVVPDLNARFGEDSPSSGGTGISTSSFSSDVNGQRTGGSRTVINKDGKTQVFTHTL